MGTATLAVAVANGPASAATGYPLLLRAEVPAYLADYARRAVRDCPTLTVRLG